MRPQHIKRDGMGFCIDHAIYIEGDCDECIADEKMKRAATHCETHDETFESFCPQCAMWKANILDQDAQEITTMPEALDPVALGVRVDWLLKAKARRFVDPSDKAARDLGAFYKAMREQATALSTKPEPQNADEWVVWFGGERPVRSHTKVKVKLRSGLEWESAAGSLGWNNLGVGGDIVAYKVIGEPQTAPSEPQSALQVQEGGDHYKKLKIQPVEYIHANGLQFAEGSVIKYVTRWRDKNGVADLKKARHFLDLLIELEGAK